MSITIYLRFYRNSLWALRPVW